MKLSKNHKINLLFVVVYLNTKNYCFHLIAYLVPQYIERKLNKILQNRIVFSMFVIILYLVALYI